MPPMGFTGSVAVLLKSFHVSKANMYDRIGLKVTATSWVVRRSRSYACNDGHGPQISRRCDENEIEKRLQSKIILFRTADQHKHVWKLMSAGGLWGQGSTVSVSVAGFI
jgi:hypothetical protein